MYKHGQFQQQSAIRLTFYLSPSFHHYQVSAFGTLHWEVTYSLFVQTFSSKSCRKKTLMYSQTEFSDNVFKCCRVTVNENLNIHLKDKWLIQIYTVLWSLESCRSIKFSRLYMQNTPLGPNFFWLLNYTFWEILGL